jgi:hypothetical protein
MVLDAVPLVAVTGLFIGVFSYFVIRLQLEDIRHNWQERRCDPFVIPLAHLIPTDPDVDTAAFSAENFQFCTNKIIDASIALASAPMQKAFTQQVETIKPINQVMHSLREGANFITKPLNTLMNGLWEKLMMIVYQFARVFSKLSSAFDRIFGIAVSSIFAGIGMYRAIRNALNFVIYVILIILLILLIIVIFLFFLLIPVMPVILTTIGVISASVFGAAVGGMADSFCVAPGTLVAMKEGWKKVEEIQPGDELREGVVEGVLRASGTSERLVTIDGVILAACHIVHDGKEWIQAGKHPLAQPYKEHVEELYCLNTSVRTWRVKGVRGELLLRDWEELPLDASLNVNSEWESLVYILLNDPSPKISFPRVAVPGRGLVGKDTQVKEAKRGNIPITQVRIGDRIQDSQTTFTKVLAVYRDQESAPRSGASHAAWIWDPVMELWTHSPHYSSEAESSGYHLITESGVFMINGKTALRDFTEVGLNRIGQTYSFVLSKLSSSSNHEE